MARETERKFLVNGNFLPYVSRSYTIKQGYLQCDPARTVRVRIKGNRAYLTVKGISSQSGITRNEWEYEIPIADAEEMLQLCGENKIEKIRYEVPCGNLTFEVDEFLGANKGLLLAEIELPQENTPFEKPEWLGAEVTGDVRYYNSSLSGNSCNKW